MISVLVKSKSSLHPLDARSFCLEALSEWQGGQVRLPVNQAALALLAQQMIAED